MDINNELLFTVTIDKELKNGNTGRTKHWSSAHKDKAAWMKGLRGAEVCVPTGLCMDLPLFLADVLQGRPVASKVGIVVERVLGPRQRFWDADSALRGAKELIDSFVTSGLLEDDNMKHVSWCVGMQDDSQKHLGPLTVVKFFKEN